jgi:hypothetical protein
MPSFDLHTVAGYIADARVLLLDQIAPYRYTDDSLLVALNLALLDGRRLRPDLFVYKWGTRVPSYNAVTGQEVPIEGQFRKAFIYGLVSHALARDQEDVQDARSTLFLQTMEDILMGTRRPPIANAGTTPPGQAQR